MKLVCVGGHLAPLLATIEALPKDVEVLILGRKYTFEGDSTESLEYQTINSLGFAFKPITTGRLQRKFTEYSIFSLLKFPLGFFQSLSILRNFKPDVLMSYGGYVSLPVGFAAFFLGIPIVIHEQTTEAGWANKIISYFAQKICISWESSIAFFPREKTVLTGNPIRKFEIRNSKFEIKKDDVPLIYITGGSSGSHSINNLVEGCIKRLLKDFRVIHQTGDAREFKDFEKLQDLSDSFDEKLKKRYLLIKFVMPSEVGSILEKADLVISRSGANTIAELMAFGKPAFLIPLPHSQNNEQMKNALLFKKTGLGEIGLQDKFTSEKLYHQIVAMIQNINTYKKAKEQTKNLIKPSAAKRIVDVLLSVYVESTKKKTR